MSELRKNAEHRRSLRDAGWFIGGWIAIAGLCVFAYGVIGFLLHPIVPGPEVIVFADYTALRQGVLFSGLVGGIFFVLLLSSVKTNRGLLIVGLLFVSAVAAGAWELYSPVAAIAFNGRVVELRYVWPRPPVRLTSAEIVQSDYEQRVHGGDEALFEYTVRLRTAQRDYVTFGDTSLAAAQQVIRRLREMGAH